MDQPGGGKKKKEDRKKSRDRQDRALRPFKTAVVMLSIPERLIGH